MKPPTNALDMIVTGLGSGLFTIMAYIFVLSIVVVIHELGHFLVARWCGVKVDAFAMGFGREIFGWNDSKGTRWRLNWIPLGGYVKFMDDANGASVPDADVIAAMTPEERATSFHAKPLWQKAAVIAAGPIANFLLAIVVLASLFMFWGVRTFPARVEALATESPASRAGMHAGDLITMVDGSKISGYNELSRLIAVSAERTLLVTFVRDGQSQSVSLTPDRKELPDGLGGKASMGDAGFSFKPVVGEVTEQSPAMRGGLQAGDLITDVDGKPISSFTDLVRIVSVSGGRELALTFARNGQPATIKITPEAKIESDGVGGKVTVGRLGIKTATSTSESTFRRYGPIDAVGLSIKESYFIVSQNLFALGRIFSGRESAAQLGGPLKIAAVSGKAAALGFDSLLNVVAVISLGVGLFNLFPIPILDGGHLLFYAAEAIAGRSLSPSFKDAGFRVGFSVIVMLIIFVMWNDITSVVWHNWLGG